DLPATPPSSPAAACVAEVVPTSSCQPQSSWAAIVSRKPQTAAAKAWAAAPGAATTTKTAATAAATAAAAAEAAIATAAVKALLTPPPTATTTATTAAKAVAPVQAPPATAAKAAQQAAPGWAQGASKFQGKQLCRYPVGIEEDGAFRVCRRLIGPGGENMKHIVSSAGGGVAVKLRLRGQGSKYLEGPKHEESSDPLMLCVSAESREAFAAATSLVEELLEQVHADYREFCKSRRKACPDLMIRREVQKQRAF
ncbi:unnamed protein product, partial [Polarella glacialis]